MPTPLFCCSARSKVSCVYNLLDGLTYDILFEGLRQSRFLLQ